MPDDVLRLRATVVSEEALANIRAIGREIGMVPAKAGKGVQQVNSSFAELGKTIKGVGSELKSAVPSLGAFGLGAAGVGLAARTLIGSLSDISAKIVQMKYASKELGMSEQALRAFSEEAQKAGIAPETMMAGLQNFKRNTFDFKNRLGELRGELYAMGAGDFVNRVKNTTNQLDALKEAFDFKEVVDKFDPSGDKARIFFGKLGLGPEVARLSWERFYETYKTKKVLSPDDIAAAEKFNSLLITMGESFDMLKVKVGVRLIPAISRDLEDLAKIVDKLGELDAWIAKKTGKGGGEPGGAPAPGGDALPWWLGRTLPGRIYNFSRKLMRDTPLTAPDGASPAAPQGSQLRPGSPGFKPISFGGFGNDGGEQSSASRIVQTGVFDALVEFQSYAGVGGAGTGGGFTNASYHPGGGGADNTPIGRAFRAAGQNGTGTTGGTDGGAPRNAQLNDEAGKPIDAATMKEAENLGRSGDTAGLQKLFAQKGYRMSGPACGIVASAYVKSAGFKPPPGGAIASNWNDWGQKTDAGDINKEGRPFGSMIASYQNRRYGGDVGAPLGKGQTGGHVMNIVPGTYDPKTGTAMFADQYGVRRRSLKGMDLRYAGDDAVAAAAKAQGNAALPNGQAPTSAGEGTKATWFNAGAPFQAPGGKVWSDPAGQREGKQASGAPNTEPGIATPGRGGLNEWHEVTLPDGRKMIVRKSDIGPGKGAQGRGVGVDINAAAAAQAYPGGPGTFPSGKGGFQVRRIGKDLPPGTQPGLQTNRIDNANKPPSVNGNVNVTVNSNGTKADAKVNEAGDLYQGTTVKQHKQMQRTEDAGESLSI